MLYVVMPSEKPPEQTIQENPNMRLGFALVVTGWAVVFSVIFGLSSPYLNLEYAEKILTETYLNFSHWRP